MIKVNSELAEVLDTTVTKSGVLYRYETYDKNYNMQDDRVIPDIQLLEYKIVKTTPKGVWIDYRYCRLRKKWVSLYARKRFAYPTRREAMLNFKRRLATRRRIVRHSLKLCEATLLILDIV